MGQLQSVTPDAALLHECTPGARTSCQLEYALLLLLPFAILLWRAPGIDYYLSSLDHGYQLSMGQQVHLGKFPFVNLFTHYGPLTVFTSALGLLIWDSPLPETLICVIGYALALFFMAELIRRRISLVAALIAIAAGLILMARFYKWYYWLFPLVCLYLLDRASSSHRRALLLAVGVSVSLAALYRLDLGAACGVLVLVVWFALWRPRQRPVIPDVTDISVGVIVPFAIWLATLVVFGGPAAVTDYLFFTVWGARTVAVEASLPWPVFSWREPMSQESVLAASYALVGLTYAASVSVALFLRRQLGQMPILALAAGASIAGICLLPQALHRKDGAHLVQVIPPMVIASICLGIFLWREMPLPRRTWSWLIRSGSAIYWGCLIIVALSIRTGGDLLSFWDNPLPRYSDLARGISSRPDHTFTKLSLVVQSETSRSDPVLVLPQGLAWASRTELLYCLSRPVSGILSVYVGAIYSDDLWRLRNFRAVVKNPPAVVLTGVDFLESEGAAFARYHPELSRFILTHYTEVVSRQDGWMVLRQPDTSSEAGRQVPPPLVE